MRLKSAQGRTLAAAHALLCLTFVHALAQEDAQAPARPDVAALVREARERSDHNWAAYAARRNEYTFKWRKTWRGADGKGRVKEKSETVELYIPRCPNRKCENVWITLEKDGKVVAAEQVERERRKAGRKLEREESRGGEAAADRPSQPYWLQFVYYTRGMFVEDRSVKIDGPEILEKCELTYAGRERVRGREMFALDFRPRAGAAFGRQTWFMPGMEGRIWIDAEEKVFARLAAWPKGARPAGPSSDALLREAALAYDTVRTREGLWFTALGRVNGLKYPGLFGGVKSDFSIETFDHARFAVEADVKLNAPEK